MCTTTMNTGSETNISHEIYAGMQINQHIDGENATMKTRNIINLKETYWKFWLILFHEGRQVKG